MKIRAILWDNDGVLVNTEPWYYEATRQVMARYDFFLTPEMHRQINMVEGQSSLALLPIDDQNLMEHLHQLRNRYYSFILQNVQEHLLNQQIPSVLNQLQNQFKMAIVTSCRSIHFKKIHQNTQILHYFKIILTRENFTFSKPHPESYLKATSLLHIPPQESIVIEDSPRGCQAALNAGMNVIIVPNEFSQMLDFPDHSAVHFVSNIAEIPSLVQNLRSR